MQPSYNSILLGSGFEDPLERSQWRKFKQMQPHFENAYMKTHREKVQTNATNETLITSHFNFDKGLIWKDAVKKRKTNATYTIMHRTGLKTPWRKVKCYFACSDPSSSSQHLKTHSGEKSNKCNQCTFESFQTGNLREHLKTHSGDK